MNKRNYIILINVVLIAKDLLKIDTREPKVANIDDTLYIDDNTNNIDDNTNFKQIIVRWFCIKCFSGFKVLILKIATNNPKVAQFSTGMLTFLQVFI